MANQQKKGPLKSGTVTTHTTIFHNYQYQTFFIALLSVVLYANTCFNEFALDDGLVLSNNKLVLQGISGIPDIIAHDSFYGSIGNSSYLTGGRYRPLSLVSFAIEVSLFGKDPFHFHLFNVLLFAITALMLFRLLRVSFFKTDPVAAFVVTLLFVIHPIHTEVVANIKSRDEIYSLLFLILTLYHLLLYLDGKKNQSLLISLLFYAAALFSKENGIIFIAIVPLTVFMFSQHLKQVLTVSIPYIALAAIYVLVRYMLIGIQQYNVTEVMDNPYVLATPVQKMATIAFVMLSYLRLMLFPYPITFDYSYQQIPYKNFTDAWVVLSLLLYNLFILYSIINLPKRKTLVWCTLFFMFTMLLISNLFFNVGAPMAERFLYQASVPFLMAIVIIAKNLKSTISNKKEMPVAFTLLLLILIPLFSFQIIQRNRQWKNDETLFLHDVKTSYGSARANTYAGIALLRLADRTGDQQQRRFQVLEAISYFNCSETIKKNYLPALLNMGVAYSRIDSIETAENIWNRARKLDPENATLKSYSRYLFETYYQKGIKAGKEKKFAEAITCFEKAIIYNSSHAESWYNLGGACYSNGEFEKAGEAWKKTLELKPDHSQAKQGLQSLSLKRY